MLRSGACTASGGGHTAKNILSHNQNIFVDSVLDDPPKGAMKISSMGSGGVSLRNSDKTPPGPASSQEVMVQYESLCPDTVVFFGDLKKVYADDNLRNQFTFELVPYGNVRLPKDKKLDPKKPWGGRVCQHGERECWGNAWQACTHATVSERSRIVQHTICLMDLPKQGMPEKYWQDDPWSCGDYMQCVVDRCDDGALTAQEKADIGTCVGKVRNSENSKGTMEMDSHEKAAELWNVTHVPWIVVNGKHVQELDDNKISLRKYLEDHLEPNDGSQKIAEETLKANDGSQKTEKASSKESSSNSVSPSQRSDQPMVAKEEPDDAAVENAPLVNSQERSGGKSSADSLSLPHSSHHQPGTAMAIASVIMLAVASLTIFYLYKKNKGGNVALR